MIRIADHWETYLAARFGIKTPAQIREMRLAFYAGAHALFAELTEMDDPLSTEEYPMLDPAKLEEIATELRSFAREVMRKAA